MAGLAFGGSRWDGNLGASAATTEPAAEKAATAVAKPRRGAPVSVGSAGSGPAGASRATRKIVFSERKKDRSAASSPQETTDQ
jgi:hypothetical protein